MITQDFDRLHVDFLTFNLDQFRKYFNDKAWILVQKLIKDKKFTILALNVINFV